MLPSPSRPRPDTGIRIALRIPRITGCLIAALSAACHLAAEEPLPGIERLTNSPVLRSLRPNPMPRPPATPAEQTVARMFVPEGFRVDLIASEPVVHQPVAMAWDERGRLWVAEAHSYPTKRPAGQGEDRLIILADREGDGHFESRTVFAEKLNLVSGFELGFGGVWIGAAPELLFLADANRDDIPDGPPKVLLDGFGYQDTHECLNSFLWGPDGWLYGIQGVFNFARIGRPGAPDGERQELRAGVWRYHPVRHTFEIFAHGGSNPWGLDYDEHGQLFMTHCRSYWGRGGTTHVIQGGQFWNQANANYAPWIVAEPPGEFPGFRNYLLASARYDHGAGGAGVPGSDAIYGGHSHVGTLIYQGDNWPEAWRGHLFTHNLHGHQINHQINQPEGSGFHTVHGGQDIFFCTDPTYVAVDLQTGPDGAVYFCDWSDRQHCHNPNTERWDRSNGRLYRMAFAATHQPRPVDLSVLSDRELAALLQHRNAWYPRMAHRLLTERALGNRRLEATAKAAIEHLARKGPTAAARLRGLWTAHTALSADPGRWEAALQDPDAFVRAWAVQMIAEDGRPPDPFPAMLRHLAQTDPSPRVRLALASAAQRLPAEDAWAVLESLARHAEDLEDRNLPPLIWTSLAPRMAADPTRALSLAATTALPQLSDWIHWYAAVLGGGPLEQSLATLSGADDATLRRRLAGLWLATEPKGTVRQPAAWKPLSARLQGSPDPAIVRPAQQLAAAFGDTAAFADLRHTLAERSQPPEDRKHAFAVLSRVTEPGSLPVFLDLLEDPEFRVPSLRVLARYDDPRIAPALLAHYAGWGAPERAAALDVLTRRPDRAAALLDAVAAKTVARDQLTALHLRQMSDLHAPEVDRRITRAWGRLQATPAETLDRIAVLQRTFEEAPLWAYDGRAGRAHFQRLCASCHVLGADGQRIGPELTGAGRNGIRYFLENIVDPDAVVGSDFQLTTVEMRDGEVVSGLVLQETEGGLTLRTVAEQRVLPKTAMVRRELSERSLMPGGLLESLNPREQLELLKYLTGN